jgi:hypothetical protein
MLPVSCFGQKIAPYKYKDVDTVYQYQDAQIIYYNDKNGKHKRDTIWMATQKKDIEIEFARRVITTDMYLKPRLKWVDASKAKKN